MKTKIRDLRIKLGMTQEDLAGRISVTRQTINALEQGRYNPSLELACKITKALKKKFVEDVFKI